MRLPLIDIHLTTLEDMGCKTTRYTIPESHEQKRLYHKEILILMYHWSIGSSRISRFCLALFCSSCLCDVLYQSTNAIQLLLFVPIIHLGTDLRLSYNQSKLFLKVESKE